jgi:hypothetical protein
MFKCVLGRSPTYFHVGCELHNLCGSSYLRDWMTSCFFLWAQLDSQICRHIISYCIRDMNVVSVCMINSRISYCVCERIVYWFSTSQVSWFNFSGVTLMFSVPHRKFYSCLTSSWEFPFHIRTLARLPLANGPSCWQQSDVRNQIRSEVGSPSFRMS